MAKKAKTEIEDQSSAGYVTHNPPSELFGQSDSKPISVPAPFFTKLLDANRKKHGSKTLMVGSEQRVIGLEPYSIALQYIMDLEVVPLQAIINIAGEEKTYKTSIGLEFCKMFLDLQPVQGIAVVNNTEGKWSPSKSRSMLGHHNDVLQVIQNKSVEEWQASATSNLLLMQEVVDKKKDAIAKKAKTSEYKDMVIPPMIIMVDSLTGSQSDKIVETVQAEGFGSKTFQDRALINHQFFSTWGSNLIGMPVTIVITNHLKIKLDGAPGIKQWTTSGGSGPSFMCSMEIRVKRIGEIDKTYIEGAKLLWKMHHNSLGRDKRQIEVHYMEGYDAEDNQKAYFDWDSTLIMCLLERLEESAYKDRILGVLGEFNEYPKAGFGKVYSCGRLGIDKDKAIDEGVGATELGRMLQTDPVIREELKAALRIQKATKWTPDIEM